MDVAVNKVVDNYRIDQSQLEEKRTQQLQSCTTAQQRQQVNREFDAKQQQSTAALMESLQSTIQQTAQEMQQTIVRTVETNQKEQEKKRATRTPSVTICGASPAPSRPSLWHTATRT